MGIVQTFEEVNKRPGEKETGGRTERGGLCRYADMELKVLHWFIPHFGQNKPWKLAD